MHTNQTSTSQALSHFLSSRTSYTNRQIGPQKKLPSAERKKKKKVEWIEGFFQKEGVSSELEMILIYDTRKVTMSTEVIEDTGEHIKFKEITNSQVDRKYY